MLWLGTKWRMAGTSEKVWRGRESNPGHEETLFSFSQHSLDSVLLFLKTAQLGLIFVLPPYATARIWTHISRVAPTRDLLKDALPTELPRPYNEPTLPTTYYLHGPDNTGVICAPRPNFSHFVFLSWFSRVLIRTQPSNQDFISSWDQVYLNSSFLHWCLYCFKCILVLHQILQNTC